MARHEDSAFIDRIGAERVKARFGLSRQGLTNWRNRGVPQLRRISFAKMAVEYGVEVPRDFLKDIGI
jgi:hypothetical protein